MTIGEIYRAIDSLAPFGTQEKWDNSGLLVGSPDDAVSGVLVTLDITKAAVQKARESGCDLIVSHHPVIFDPLHSLERGSVVYALAENGIGAICSHTPLDLAVGGLNDLLADRLRTVIAVEQTVPFLPDGLGRILTLGTALTVREIAAEAKTALHCPFVRFARADLPVKRLAICTGSGASLLEDCRGAADCLLTGDVKHDRWYRAAELRLGLIDCGHFETEVIMVPYVARQLHDKFPSLHIETAAEPPFAYV